MGSDYLRPFVRNSVSASDVRSITSAGGPRIKNLVSGFLEKEKMIAPGSKRSLRPGDQLDECTVRVGVSHALSIARQDR